MSRINSIDPQTATGTVETLLQTVQSKMGMVPNMTRAMAAAPAVLDAYLQLSGALQASSLNAQLREKLALVTAETNGCGYCLAAHSAVGKMVGLPESEITSNRRGTSSDARHQAALTFAQRFLDSKGAVSDDDLAAVRAAGFSDGEIAEIAAHVSASTFTNYFNRLVQPALDFPAIA